MTRTPVKRFEPDPTTGAYPPVRMGVQLKMLVHGARQPVDLEVLSLQSSEPVLTFEDAPSTPSEKVYMVSLAEEVVEDPARLAQLSGTTIRVTADVRPVWTAGEMTYLAEQDFEVVPRPLQLVVDVVEPGDPIPADGGTHPLQLQVRPVGDAPYRGVLSLRLEREPGRAGPTLDPAELPVDTARHDLVDTSLVVPRLTYDRTLHYRERLVVSASMGDAEPFEVATHDLWLSPEITLDLQPHKPGLAWAPETGGWEPLVVPDHARVREVLGQLTVHEAMPDDASAEVRRAVAHGGVAIVAPPDTRESPSLDVAADDVGGFSITPPGLAPRTAYREPGLGTLRLDPALEGGLDPDLRTRLGLMEDVRVPRARDGRHPMDEVLTESTLREILRWRLRTTTQLAAGQPEDLPRAQSAIDIAEAAACYAGHFAETYYTYAESIVSQFRKLLEDAVSLSITWFKVAERLVAAAPAAGEWVGAALNRVWRVLRPLVAPVLDLARQLVAKIPSLAAVIDGLDHAFSVTSSGSGWFTDALKWLCKGIGHVLRWLASTTASFAGQVLDEAIQALRSTGEFGNATLLKWIEELLQQAYEWTSPTMERLGDEVSDLSLQMMGLPTDISPDVYPFVMRRVTARVVGHAEDLRVPEDAEAQVDRLMFAYRDRLHAQHELSQSSAVWEERLAMFKLAIAFLQAAFMLGGVAYRMAGTFSKEIALQLSQAMFGTDVIQHLTSGLKHVLDIIMGLGSAIWTAGASGYAVAELTWDQA